MGVREREGEQNRREGHGPAQSPLSADLHFPVLRLDPSPGPGPDHSYSPPPSHFSYFNCLRPHRAFCHPQWWHSIWSAPFGGPPVTPRAVLLCHLVGSSSACQQSRLRTQCHTTGSCAKLKPSRCKARHTRHHCKALVPS